MMCVCLIYLLTYLVFGSHFAGAVMLSTRLLIVTWHNANRTTTHRVYSHVAADWRLTIVFDVAGNLFACSGKSTLRAARLHDCLVTDKPHGCPQNISTSDRFATDKRHDKHLWCAVSCQDQKDTSFNWLSLRPAKDGRKDGMTPILPLKDALFANVMISWDVLFLFDH